MKIKVNARLKPNPLFEIRYIRSNYGGSFPIIGVWLNTYSLMFALHPFYLSFMIARGVRPSPFTEIEKEILRQEDL